MSSDFVVFNLNRKRDSHERWSLTQEVEFIKHIGEYSKPYIPLTTERKLGLLTNYLNNLSFRRIWDKFNFQEIKNVVMEEIKICKSGLHPSFNQTSNEN